MSGASCGHDVGPISAFSLSAGLWVYCQNWPEAEFRMNWRRGRDSNPRDGYPPSSFQDWRLQPLGHLSKAPSCEGGQSHKGRAARWQYRSSDRPYRTGQALGRSGCQITLFSPWRWDECRLPRPNFAGMGQRVLLLNCMNAFRMQTRPIVMEPRQPGCARPPSAGQAARALRSVSVRAASSGGTDTPFSISLRAARWSAGAFTNSTASSRSLR